MALAVRGRRRRSPVSERVRADRPVVWKGTGLEGPAAQQSGIRTTHGADALHDRGCFGGAPLPWPLASTILVKVLIELVDADHQVFPGQAKTVTFTVPAK